MDVHLINRTKYFAGHKVVPKKSKECFFSKQMTYVESHDFVKNEMHLASCEDCRMKILKFQFQREEFLRHYASYKADIEVQKILERELDEIIPNENEIERKENSEIKISSRPYSLSIKDFLVYLAFGISRKMQIVLVSLLVLAACIY